MFSLGVELDEVLKKQTLRTSSPIAVGVATGISMLITHRMLASVFDLTARTRVVCYQAPIETLVSLLLTRKIDLAITDCALGSSSSVRVRSQLVGQCGATFFCAKNLAERYRSGFPQSLNRAPFVMPTGTSALGVSLSDWFRRERIAPSIVAEIESPGLITALCENGVALFALPTVIAEEVERRYRVLAVGQAPIAHQFYAAHLERQIGRDGISAMIELARGNFCADGFAAEAVPEADAAMRPAVRSRIDPASRRHDAADEPLEGSAAVYRLADRATLRRRE
jgi:LysR family transcriptional activator of nhaA